MIKFFLAGIIQGSIADKSIYPQEYRNSLKNVIYRSFPDADVYCPIENFPDSLAYSPDKGRETFFYLMQKCTEADVLIAYVPEASMGTAIEMWQAHTSGRIVLTVSPLGENWVIRFLSTRIFLDEEALETYLASDEFKHLLKQNSIS